MESERRLKRKRDLLAVQRQGRYWSNQLLVVRALPNELESSRFGFVVRGRVGKAVVRNRVKRRLREIVRREPVDAGWDVVFIARVKIAQVPFPEVQTAVRELLRRSRLQDRPMAGASLLRRQG